MTLDEALSYHLSAHNPAVGDLRTDLIKAAHSAYLWRARGPQATAVILHAMRTRLGMSLREIEETTGIDHVTAARLIQRWIPEAKP
jgi:hypothetical protein